MGSRLEAGLASELKFQIPYSKTVPALYPESSEFQQMPEVLATGFMIGLLEWACIKAINPCIDWPRQQSLGTHINVSHLAATPPGMVVTVKVTLTQVDGRRLVFEVEAHDGTDIISRGTHERFLIDRGKFLDKIKDKASRLASAS